MTLFALIIALRAKVLVKVSIEPILCAPPLALQQQSILSTQFAPTSFINVLSLSH